MSMAEADRDDLVLWATQGDINAMHELARRQDPEYTNAFRQACIEVLGEDPDEWADMTRTDEGGST